MKPSKISVLWVFFALVQVHAGPVCAAYARCKLSDIQALSSPGYFEKSDAENKWRIKIEVTNSCKYCDVIGVKVQVLQYDSSSICDVPVGSPVLIKDGKSISSGEKVELDYYQSSAVVSVYNCLSVKSARFVNCRK